jgi:hypothetical protein
VTYPVLHAGNFALPAERGDFGSGAVERMGTGHVFVVLFEYGPQAASTPLFARRGRPRPTPADFRPNQLQRIIRGQTGAQYFYHEAGRAFCLYVVLGSAVRRAPLTAEAGRLLSGVTVRPQGG